MMLGRFAAIFLALGAVSTAPYVVAADTPPKGGETRLPTDGPVRKGMLAIRDLVRTNHSLVTHRRMPPDHAQRFARQVKAESEKLLSATKLSGDGREKLRGLLDEIVAGIEVVAKPAAGADPLDGLVRADEALARYGKEFDHPDWPPLQSLNLIGLPQSLAIDTRIWRGSGFLTIPA